VIDVLVFLLVVAFGVLRRKQDAEHTQRLLAPVRVLDAVHFELLELKLRRERAVGALHHREGPGITTVDMPCMKDTA
jgi:hypothetical protein